MFDLNKFGGGIEITMEIDLSGKTGIVTGGTRGIGRSIVMHLIESGCDVIYTGTKSQIKNPVSKARYEQLDLSDRENIKRFSEKVISKLPRVDILINNAGINIIEPIDEVRSENWDKVLNVNLTGSMYIMREVAKVMKKNKKGGKILNISSIFGIVSRAKRNAYSASKAGLIGLTRASALDLAPDNILVNAICPGFTSTELSASILSKKEIKELTSKIPLGRFADVSEIAKIAVTLCSELNTYLTGQTIVIDGGVTIE